MSGEGSKEECKAQRNFQNLGQDYNHCLWSMDPAPELFETPPMYHLIPQVFSSQQASMERVIVLFLQRKNLRLERLHHLARIVLHYVAD